jgi:hypothetical protein
MELDQQPICNGKLPNLWGNIMIFRPNIQWVGNDCSSGLPDQKVQLMPKKQGIFSDLTENRSNLRVWAEWKRILCSIVLPNEGNLDSHRSTLPARLICAPGPFVGLISRTR